MALMFQHYPAMAEHPQMVISQYQMCILLSENNKNDKYQILLSIYWKNGFVPSQFYQTENFQHSRPTCS